jgi:hypothetical protein
MGRIYVHLQIQGHQIFTFPLHYLSTTFKNNPFMLSSIFDGGVTVEQSSAIQTFCSTLDLNMASVS